MEILKLYYPDDLIPEWNSGRLQENWTRQYPGAFDADDMKLALSQRRYHFGEWFTAVYFAKLGYDVLVEKYLYPVHPGKLKKAGILLPADKVEELKAFKPRHQFPDLLIYNNDGYFFAEVKKDTDTLKSSQADFFHKIEEILKTKVLLVEVRRKDN